MATKVTWVLVLSSVGVVGLSGWCMYTGPDRVDLSTAHGKAFQYLREGRYDEAMRTITAVEAAARANLNHRPGPAISILMTKAQIRSLQMNMEDSERFLSQLEKECVGTPAADWVRVAACSERAFGYRLMEDWPEAVRAMEKERELLVLQERTGGQDEVDGLDALFRRFYIQAQAPAQIADMHRFLGRTEIALVEYRAALDYLNAHPEVVKPLHNYMQRIHNESFCPCRYREVILPRAIRDCEAGCDSPLGILARCVTCEADQGDYLLAIGSAYQQRHALEAARRHYDNAQRAIETNRCALDSLDPEEEVRYTGLEEQIRKNINACNSALSKFGPDQS
jgi:tetratricopeptide (TPR) repeat protein